MCHHGLHRLFDFAVVDGAGDMQPLDAMTTYDKELFITGAIYAKAADVKNKDAGRRVQQRIGPIASWSLELRTDLTGPLVTITTASGRYLAFKPSQRYRKTHDHLTQQGAIAWEVLGCIDPGRGGVADASLETVIAKITRAGVRGWAAAATYRLLFCYLLAILLCCCIFPSLFDHLLHKPLACELHTC